ncbi:DUF6789 family protein [Salinisphaera sp.]|uniref:DUF6789 family protein n=1 Tax=Salinisphaera sp. TaxID=1914330 RepID=UPI002D794B06|nr:DUF6789 family protein [Salinisphaera sp.]HET7313917.1 DUF6789 family protein [Salinisphaera sp.]
MNPGKGIVAGFIATVAISVLMIVKAFSHRLSAFNTIEIIHRLLGGPLVTGWIGHFVIGSLIWGVLFAVFYRRLPGGYAVVRGLVFGVYAWLAMMLLFLPVGGIGFFGVAIGWPVVGFTLAIHLVYGAVLGASYGSMTGQR